MRPPIRSVLASRRPHVRRERNKEADNSGPTSCSRSHRSRPDVPYQIVGVVGNEKMQGLIDDGSEGFYASMDQHSFYNPNLTVRAAIDPQTLQGAIRTQSTR